MKLGTGFAAAAAFIAITFGWLHVAPSDPDIIINVSSVIEVDNHLRKLGFHDIDSHPERLRAVPRVGIVRLPKVLSNAWREDVSLRKSVFFRVGLSQVLQVNEEILAERKRLLGLRPGNLSADDHVWLTAALAHYRVTADKEMTLAGQLAALALRIDMLPPSMVIVQGAIESAWLQSRFARMGQAIFGQWTTSQSGMKALHGDARLAKFDTPRQALTAYMRNLNTHPAYAGLRMARADLRRRGQLPDGDVLAGHLTSYAETGEDYVALVRRMIREDDLTRFDRAQLAPGPNFLYRVTL